MTSISIPSEVMQSIVQKAILEGISEEQRNLLMEQAVKYLTTQPKTSYGMGASLSPLEQAFNQAVAKAAQDLVEDLVKNTPEFTRRIEAQVNEAMVEYLKSNSVLADNVGIAIGSAISTQLRDKY